MLINTTEVLLFCRYGETDTKKRILAEAGFIKLLSSPAVKAYGLIHVYLISYFYLQSKALSLYSLPSTATKMVLVPETGIFRHNSQNA